MRTGSSLRADGFPSVFLRAQTAFDKQRECDIDQGDETNARPPQVSSRAQGTWPWPSGEETGKLW